MMGRAGRAVSIAWIGTLTLCAHRSRAQSAPASTTGYPPAPVETARPVAPPPLSGTEAPPAAPPAYPPAPQPPPPQPPPPYYYPPPPAQYAPQQPPPSYATPPAGPQRSEWRPSQPGVILAIERAFGLYFSSGRRGGPESTTAPPTDTDLSGSSVNVLGGSPTGSFNPFSVPFVSLHGVIAEGFTFGGGIGYQSDSLKNKYVSHNDLSAVVVAPRVGFVTDLGKNLAVWIRGGVTYSSQTFNFAVDCAPLDSFCSGGSSKQTYSLLDVSLDPTFVIVPIPHLGFLVGPTIDIALSGKETLEIPLNAGSDPNSAPTGDRDFRLSSFGIAAGVALFL